MKTMTVVGATVIALTAIWPVAASAHARPLPPLAPKCTDWAFPGDFGLRQDDGSWVSFNLRGKEFPREGVRAMGIVQNDYWYGTARGGSIETSHAYGFKGVVEGDVVAFTVYWDKGPVGNYFGHVVDESGFVDGWTFDKTLPTRSDVHWRSHNRLECLTPTPGDRVLVPDVVNECQPGGPCPFANPPAPAPPQGNQPLNPPPSTKTATVAADVDVYNAKNEPDGAGHVVGILRAEPRPQQVELVGDCAPESWCQVKGPNVPGGQGWVWGHLLLP